MLILGLSPFKHDAAAALLVDGNIKAAVENDKLVRARSTGLPEAAIHFCLETVGASWQDLDVIAVGSSPFSGWRRRSLLPVRLATPSLGTALSHEVSEVGMFAQALNQIRNLRTNNGNRSKLLSFEHHLCHAASTFFLSPFERALILTMDEEGDGNSGMFAIGEGTRIHVQRNILFPSSLAWVYTAITELLGFVPHHDEHKTQWLSLGGEPIFKCEFLQMFESTRGNLPKLNTRYLKLAAGLKFSQKFYHQFGLGESGKDLSDDLRRGLASSLQHACVEVVSSTLEQFREREGIEAICLAGGLFQNTLLAASLERRLGLNRLFVPAASGNAGCALGAALLAWHQHSQAQRSPAVHCLYSGPASNRSEIKDVLDNCKTRYALQTTEECKLKATVPLLAQGKIVGWFQGAAEFGPRALGNRSLLASPWAPYVKENLNDYIKHREWFRPFAIAVTEEDCARYFECSELCKSMSSLAWIKFAANTLLRDFVLPGNLVRLHVVQREKNPLFWQLLKFFGKQAPAPLLVNTSFNLFGEPLVVKPRDAIRSYFCSGVDALMIGNFLLAKAGVKAVQVSKSSEAGSVAIR